jgi:hypothetical protein
MKRFLIACALLLATGRAIAQPHYLIDNFTATRINSPAEGSLAPDEAAAKVGLAGGRWEYRINPQRTATLMLPDRARPFPAPGALKLWIRGDNSGNEIELLMKQGDLQQQPDGSRSLANVGDVGLPRLKLDFDGWREITIPLPQLRAGAVAWWAGLRISQPPDGKVMAGSIALDDLRLYPSSASPLSTVQADLIGPSPREFSAEIAASVDVRSFFDRAAPVKVRLTITDRNEQLVADRDFPLELAPGAAVEERLAVSPENLDAFLPPFNVSIDVLAVDLPEANQKVDRTLVMGNGIVLFDDFSNVFGRWFTAGYNDNRPDVPMDRKIRSSLHTWWTWTHGEGQRFCALPQTGAAIAPVAVDPAERAAATQSASPAPLGEQAMKLDYAGEAVVYTSFDRYLPGQPYRLGVWVRGDGSGSKLSILTLDYTDGSDFYEGGWRRIREGERLVTTLDFTGWKYCELSLPGEGIGMNTPRGSTPDLDYPLEITAFRVEPAAPEGQGSIAIGSIYVHTQQPAAGAMSVHVGYGDPNLVYGPSHDAWATVHNAWRVGTRKVKVNWTLLDRDETTIARGEESFDLSAGERRRVAIPLSQHAAALAPAAGPLRLQVVASDVQDVAVSPQRQIILAKPDSRVTLADFETPRGFLALKASGAGQGPSGVPVAFTTTEAAHGGKGSLLIEWNRGERANRFISIDPPLPGVPVEVSMWVHGDGSGALLYPLIGDRQGVNKGAPQGQWDLFLPRTIDQPLHNVVRADWTGWRELKFRFPPVPHTWKNELPILPFVPDYPMGLHIAVVGQYAPAESGKVLIDDITVRTHLTPEKRVSMALDRTGESNVRRPGEPVSATLANADASAPRQVRLRGGVYDWQGRAVAPIDRTIELPPATSRPEVIAPSLPPGAYQVKLSILDGDRPLASVGEDIIVADLSGDFGAEWEAALRDTWKLRKPTGDRFTLLDEDWDWVEYFPGNFQVESIRKRAQEVLVNGAEPHILLGYSAYWAAGVGQEQFRTGTYVRRHRGPGHAVDVLMVPERTEDWEEYCRQVMRDIGREVGGFVVWNNPDSEGPLGVKADTFAAMLAAADKWRRVYCPQTPLVIGGMTRQSAIPYLQKLSEFDGLKHLTGINVRLDVGRLSPEDADVAAYARQLRETVGSAGDEPRTVLLTDLDWAVERDPSGLNAFDQAAYLSRSMLLLDQQNLTPAFAIRNEDDTRLGLGLTYKREISIPPMIEKHRTLQLRPAWLAVVRTRKWLDQFEPMGEIEIRDVIPGRTRGVLYRRASDGRAGLAVWRNDDAGALSFAGAAGAAVESAEDVFGTPVAAEDGWYRVGKTPVMFILQQPADQNLAAALELLRVRDGETPTWPQQLLATWRAGGVAAMEHRHEGGVIEDVSAPKLDGEMTAAKVLKFASGGKETFAIPAPSGADLILRKQFLLDDTGQTATVKVNGADLGTWDLRRSDPQLSGGWREAIFIIPASAIEDGRAQIEITYPGPANTARWDVLHYGGGDFPLSAVGPIHADQNVGRMRIARNAIGAKLQVGTESAANGLGVFARSLVEYELNGQFKRFTAKVGVDAATEGRGSVTFEIYLDGKKAWATPTMSGLDAMREVDLDVSGARRLRLVVGDAGDGNALDAADWCEPVLHR